MKIRTRQHPVEWDAPTRQKKREEHNTQFWEAVLELEPHQAGAGPTDPGAVTMLVDLQTTSKKVQLIVAWSWGGHLFPVQLLCRYFAHWRTGECGSTSTNLHSNIAREQLWFGVVAAGEARRHEHSI